ncbi:hypothetical protein N7471_008843 [Penicillium samsonianum]|uniref:uncharacterized protein n=1 Tax=Penicillium samsonianum TaxID=1882272 RepID=UPI0025492948|nr:uncharacterized protein N7471_008843 [Penicillium samsonianum]KAJ6133628.1 hypothetical protein N7471_008843 [Penicillium samsonianum]
MENEDSIGQTLDIWGIGKRIVQIMVLNNRTMNCMGFPTHHAIYDRHSIHEIFRQFDEPPKPFVQYYNDINKGNHSTWVEKLRDFKGPLFPDPSLAPEGHTILTDANLQSIIPRGPQHSCFTVSNMFRLALALTHARQTGSLDVVFHAGVSSRGIPVPNVRTLTNP